MTTEPGQDGECWSAVGEHHLDGDACRCGLLVRRPPTAGQDGERLVSEEMVERARKAYGGDGIGGSHSGAWPFAIHAALAAVAPDIAAAARQAAEAERDAIQRMLNVAEERMRLAEQREDDAKTDRDALAAAAPDIAADADQRWTTELNAQADRYASVGTEIADAMADALRTAVRIMHRAPTETRTGTG